MDGTVKELDGGGAELRFERSLAHPVERVWDAITRPEELAEWFLPYEAEIDLELVPGGTYEMRVLRVDPPRLFEHTAMDEGTMRWELEPDGDGCRLVMTQTVSDFARAVENHYASGMHHSLERLELLLGGTPSAWSWPRWEELRDQYVAKG